jgi:hypothetical protein
MRLSVSFFRSSTRLAICGAAINGRSIGHKAI